MAEQVFLIILFIVIGFLLYNRKKYIATREEFDLLSQSVYRIEDRLKNFKDENGNTLTLEQVMFAVFNKYNKESENESK